ncbi:MAG: zinc-dependent metalloprotease [Gammaproteobacteria bacterium]|nr:zinc-dependent metalloprotease [Gammaproteobacteria bacterium]
MRRLPLILICLLMTFVTSAGAAEKSTAPTIAKAVQGSQYMDGFFDLYWDETRGKLYLKLDSFDQPFIYVSSLARGVGSNDLGLDRGQLGATRLVQFSRVGPRILLVQDNSSYIAESSDAAEILAVEQSFATSVLWGFEVIASEDRSVLVDATEFFLRDAHDVSGRLAASGEGSYQVDPTRSVIFLPQTKAFPDNTEVEALVTLTGQPSGHILGTVTPDPSAVSVHQHHSFVRLPDTDYQALPYDDRAGYIDVSSGWDDGVLHDYASPIGEPVARPLTLRHRLKKKDPLAELSEAVEPIVYYLDAGAPEPVSSAIMEGASWWNQAFEAAGYKDAFQVKLLPADADPMDLRYNVIQWVHRSTRGWSYGASVRDPRTGEIIKGQVSLGSLRVRQDYLLAEGLLAPYEDEKVPPAMLEFALARIRQLAAHEVGHTMGLEHNFAASTNNRASVMDYPFPLIKVGEEGEVDLSDAYATGIGEWDKRAILYGYQDFPAGVDATAERERILGETYDSGLRYVADLHARGDEYASAAGPANPYGSLWDNGADAVTELNRLMSVRSHVLANFSEKTIRVGRPMASIEDVLVPMYLLHRYQLEAAATAIGGLEFDYAHRGDGRQISKPVPAEQQRRAIDALLTTIRPYSLALKPDLIALIPPRPPGTPASRELFPRQTGYLFDPLAAADTAAGLSLDMMLDRTRAARMVNAHALDAKLPDFGELVDKLLKETWYEVNATGQEAELQRVVNMATLQRLIALTGDGDAQAQVRAITWDRLTELAGWLEKQSRRSPDTNWRAHYRFASGQVQRLLDDSSAIAPLLPLKAPPGSPI